MTDLEERLVTYIEDAHGLEQHMLRALDSLIETANNPEIRHALEHHRDETTVIESGLPSACRRTIRLRRWSRTPVRSSSY